MSERTVTDAQISALRAEAAESGDIMQAAVCDVALANGATALTPAQIRAGERDYSGGGLARADQRRINTVGRSA